MYTVDYFIKKFEAIPDNMWLEKSQGRQDALGNYPHCAIGWCKNKAGYYGMGNSDNSNEANSLSKLLLSAGIKSITWPRYSDTGWNVADVNNGDHPRYQQATPKQRILAALRDIKKMQAKDIDTGGKVKTVYVAVPVSITDQAKELVLS